MARDEEIEEELAGLPTSPVASVTLEAETRALARAAGSADVVE